MAPKAGEDQRFSRKHWNEKKVERQDGKAILKVGRQEFAGARKVIAMTGGGVSVFRTALEGS